MGRNRLPWHQTHKQAPYPPRIAVAQCLLIWLVEHGMTRSILARRAGISIPTLQQYMLGDKTLGKKAFDKLAAVIAEIEHA